MEKLSSLLARLDIESSRCFCKTNCWCFKIFGGGKVLVIQERLAQNQQEFLDEYLPQWDEQLAIQKQELEWENPFAAKRGENHTILYLSKEEENDDLPYPKFRNFKQVATQIIKKHEEHAFPSTSQEESTQSYQPPHDSIMGPPVYPPAKQNPQPFYRPDYHFGYPQGKSKIFSGGYSEYYNSQWTLPPAWTESGVMLVLPADFDDSSVYSISEGEGDTHQSISVMVQDTPVEETVFMAIEEDDESDDEQEEEDNQFSHHAFMFHLINEPQNITHKAKHPGLSSGVLPAIKFTHTFVSEMCKDAALAKELRDLSLCSAYISGYYKNKQEEIWNEILLTIGDIVSADFDDAVFIAYQKDIVILIKPQKQEEEKDFNNSNEVKLLKELLKEKTEQVQQMIRDQAKEYYENKAAMQKKEEICQIEKERLEELRIEKKRLEEQKDEEIRKLKAQLQKKEEEAEVQFSKEEFPPLGNTHVARPCVETEFDIPNCTAFGTTAIIDTGSSACCINKKVIPEEALEPLTQTVVFNGLNSSQQATHKIKQGYFQIEGNKFKIPLIYAFDMRDSNGIEMLIGANFLRSMKGGIRIEGDEITIYKKVTKIKTSNQTEIAKIAELEVLKQQGYIGEETPKPGKMKGELCKLDIINPDVTIEDKPLKHVTPAMEDLHKHDHQANRRSKGYFHKFVLKYDFHQVAMEEESIPWTAFLVPGGLYEWLVMPFGLKNAPAVFQRKMDKCFRGTESFIAVYIDDILVFSKNEKDHAKHLEKMLKICEDNGLVLSPTKMKIAVSTVDFLGAVIGEGTIKLQPHIIKKIVNFNEEELKTKKGLRSFLGILNYARTHIPKLGILLRPLYEKTNAHGDKRLKTSDYELMDVWKDEGGIVNGKRAREDPRSAEEEKKMMHRRNEGINSSSSLLSGGSSKVPQYLSEEYEDHLRRSHEDFQPLPRIFTKTIFTLEEPGAMYKSYQLKANQTPIRMDKSDAWRSVAQDLELQAAKEAVKAKLCRHPTAIIQYQSSNLFLGNQPKSTLLTKEKMFAFRTKKPEESSSNWKPWHKDWDAITSNYSNDDDNTINDDDDAILLRTNYVSLQRKGFLDDDERHMTIRFLLLDREWG
ncbi:ORFIII-like polyprotein [Tanacetum coccineum]